MEDFKLCSAGKVVAVQPKFRFLGTMYGRAGHSGASVSKCAHRSMGGGDRTVTGQMQEQTARDPVSSKVDDENCIPRLSSGSTHVCNMHTLTLTHINRHKRID